MKYKIIVDKQSRTNPSPEKKEYEIDIEELRCKGDVRDTLVITKGEDYVMRRLELTPYFVLKELEKPIKQVIPNVDIELFEGDNYIYLIDMAGNKFYAEYLIKNEFNDVYATKAEMSSAINQTAREVVISVDEKLTEYSKTEEMQSIIQALSNQIMLEVNKKVNGEDFTAAQILLLINNDNTSEARIKADKININGAISANGNFGIGTDGNVDMKGGKINLIGGIGSTDLISVKAQSNNSIRSYIQPCGAGFLRGDPNHAVYIYVDTDISSIDVNDSNGSTHIYGDRIITPLLTQTSKRDIKKNIAKFNVKALDIIEKADIYEYNLKAEKNLSKKHIGFIIGANYNTPKEIINKEGDAIELYSAIGILWKGIQEASKRLDDLEQNLKK